MTGFGEASDQRDGIAYAVEVRSLNNRYFKATIRLPEELASLEPELETLLRRRIQRGSITLVVKYRLGEAQATQQVNDAALLNYLDHLETIHQKVKEDRAVNIDLTALLALPGVLQPSLEMEELTRRARPALTALTETACARMEAMRESEGQLLAADLRQHCEIVQQRTAEIAQRAPLVIEEYHTRLRTRVEELMARAQLTVGQQDLLREVAVFAERSDISEEINRLTGHLQQFFTILDGKPQRDPNQPLGRTMDFIAQEMLREANTIGSKCNDRAISLAIVDVKSAIDRIKEQVQNAE